MMFMFRFPRIFSRMARQPQALVNWLKQEEVSVEIRNVINLVQDQLNAEYKYRTLVQKVVCDLHALESHCINTAHWLRTAESQRNPALLGTAAVGLFRKGHVMASNVSSYAILIAETVPQLRAIVAADMIASQVATSDTALALTQQGVIIGPVTETIASSINVSVLSSRQRRKLATRLAQIADDVAVASRYMCEEITAAQAVEPGTVVTILGQMQNLSKWLADQEQVTIEKYKKQSGHR